MTLQYILLTMLFAQNCHIIVANGNVSVVPQNTTAIINQSAYFTCSFLPTSEDVHWSLDSETNFIYAGGEIIGPFKQRFNVNISSGVSTLIISPVTSEDARKYICLRLVGFGEEQFTAFLIVLEDHPSCKSNQGRDGFIGPNVCGITPDLVELSCTIKFYGEIPPEMTWKKAGENRAVDGITTIVATNKSVTYTLRMETNLALQNTSYSCQTTQLTGNQLHCQSGFINVINIQNSKHAINKSVGDEVTCSGHADKNCTYSWQSLQSNGNVSVLSSPGGTRIKLALKLEKPGIYICEEVCVIHGVPCAIPRMVVNVPETEENKRLRFFAMTLIFLFPTILIIVYFKRRRQRENTATVVFETSRTTDDAEPKPAGGSNTNGQQGNTDEATIECETSPAVYEPLLKNSANEWHEATGGNTDQQAENVVIRNPSELIKTIRIKAAEKENKALYGMDILDDELFIATGWSSEIEVWKLNELTYSRQFEVKGLVRPFDLVSCTRNVCLYIFDVKGEDVKSREIIRLDKNGLILKRWCIENDICQSLSVTYDRNVIFATFEEDVPHILEYSPDGKLLHSIKVEPDTQLNRILHVIKVADDQFLISHGSIKYKNALHRVCVVKADRPDVDKYVLSCVNEVFGGLIGSSETQLCVPMHLAVNRDGTILVADRENSRVLLLSWPDLSFIREQIPKTSSAYTLRKAYRLCLNNSRGLLFVIDNAELPKKTRWGDGRILVFKV